jgi:hypothetical protein
VRHSACGADKLPGFAAASDSSTGVWTRLDEVDTGPDKLVPNVQQDDTDEDGGGVYVALWSKPRTAAGNQDVPRSVCLPMSVDNHDKRALEIRAEFQPRAGSPVPVPTADCGDGSAIPTRFEPSQKADGMLGFYIPSGAGRLNLAGSHNFDWYVDTGERMASKVLRSDPIEGLTAAGSIGGRLDALEPARGRRGA